MEPEQDASAGKSKWGGSEHAAIVFLALSGGAWLLALPAVLLCRQTIREDPHGDGMIGVAVFGVGAGLVGILMFLAGMVLAVLAARLPIWLRLVCLVPGALALLLADHLWASCR